MDAIGMDMDAKAGMHILVGQIKHTGDLKLNKRGKEIRII